MWSAPRPNPRKINVFFTLPVCGSGIRESEECVHYLFVKETSHAFLVKSPDLGGCVPEPVKKTAGTYYDQILCVSYI
jgi:hypothetical protein